MKLKSKPVVEDFKIVADPEGEARVTIRQATTGDHLRRADLFADTSRVWNDDEYGQVELKQKWNRLEQHRMEAWLTITSLTGIIDEDTGKEIFPTRQHPKTGVEYLAMSKQEFFDAWDRLPTDLTDEIHGYILEVNPQWDPDAEKNF